jgi:hypothetical protein
METVKYSRHCEHIASTIVQLYGTEIGLAGFLWVDANIHI